MKKMTLKPLREALSHGGRTAMILAVPYLPLLLLTWKNAWKLPDPPSPSSTTTGSLDPGVSLTPPGGADPSPGSAPPIRERSKDWVVKPLESPPWKILMTDHFAVRGDLPARDLRDIGTQAESVFDELLQRLGGNPRDIRLSIRAYSNPHEFSLLASTAGVPDAASFYDVRQAEAVLECAPSTARDTLTRMLRHEVTHLYMDRVFDRREPLWLCEGMAGWMESIHRKDDSSLGAAVQDGTWIPLDRLLKAGRKEFYSPDRIHLFYAESGSLIRYLAGRPGVLPRLLNGGNLADAEEMSTLGTRWLESIK